MTKRKTTITDTAYGAISVQNNPKQLEYLLVNDRGDDAHPNHAWLAEPPLLVWKAMATATPRAGYGAGVFGART